MGPYRLLFSVEVAHGFFADGKCRDLEFVHSHQTRRVISNAGLLARCRGNGIQLFYDRSNIEGLSRYATDEGQPLNLSFKVFSRDPLFGNYTQPDPFLDDSVLYFDNQTAQAEDTGRYRLTRAEMVGEPDFEPLSAPALSGVLEKRDRLVRPIFVVNILLSESDLTPVGESSEIATARYYIRFNHRQTFWKYYFQGDLARENLQVTDLDNGVEFECMGQMSWPDHRNALVYRSTTPLSLQERAPYRFQLKENGGAGGRVLVRRLPVASATQIGRDTLNEEIVPVSEIFVNC